MFLWNEYCFSFNVKQSKLGADYVSDHWVSCSDDEDEQEEEKELKEEGEEGGQKEEVGEKGVQAATTFPPTVEFCALSMGPTDAPRKENVEEGRGDEGG
jgi:hypothetical protein